MYIQITTKCNMRCKHCCYACAPGKGKHMPADVFKAAVELASVYDEPIVIGGGEPTLHPELLWFLGYAGLLIDSANVGPPFMVTNGTCDEKTWIILMRAYRMQSLDLRVSRDPWHDVNLMQPWVQDDAEKHRLWWGESGRRTIDPVGRARGQIAELRRDALRYGYKEVRVDPASCADARIAPDGSVWADVPRKYGGGKIGLLSEDAFTQAKSIVLDAGDKTNESRRNPENNAYWRHGQGHR